MPTHVMVDLETLGVHPGSVILQVAAVVFDPLAGTLGSGDSEFSLHADPECQALTEGVFSVDLSTVRWWFGQDPEARRRAFSGDLPLGVVLGRLRDWLRDLRGRGDGDLCVWSHGLTADVVWLEEALRRLGLSCPWTHREPRDTRTLFDLAGGLRPEDYRAPGETAHDALIDCRAQARAVCEAHRRLGLSRA